MVSSAWHSVIAIVSDPFASEQLAATKAAAIAKRCGARLTLLNTFMIPQPVTDAPLDSRDQIIESAKRERRARMERLAAKWKRQGVSVKVIVEWDYPAHEAIIRVVLREKPDLLVSHSHRHGKLARWFLANTDWELMRHCPCPMWFARGKDLPRKLKVLAAVDPTHSHAKPARLDDRLIATAVSTVTQLGGQVELVHAYDERSASGDIEREVKNLAQRFGIDSNACFTLSGEPASVLPMVAKKRQADVLVMGAVSRSMVERPVIGSTAEKIIDHVDTDVLVIKPARFKTDVPKAAPKR